MAEDMLTHPHASIQEATNNSNIISPIPGFGLLSPEVIEAMSSEQLAQYNAASRRYALKRRHSG
jgi:hypothetical protein